MPKEKKQALIQFYTLFTNLYDDWRETKSTINYSAFRKIFEISGENEKKEEKKGATRQKSTGKKEEARGVTENKNGAQEGSKNEGKKRKRESKEKPKKWVRQMLTQMMKGKLH